MKLKVHYTVVNKIYLRTDNRTHKALSLKPIGGNLCLIIFGPTFLCYRSKGTEKRTKKKREKKIEWRWKICVCDLECARFTLMTQLYNYANIVRLISSNFIVVFIQSLCLFSFWTWKTHSFSFPFHYTFPLQSIYRLFVSTAYCSKTWTIQNIRKIHR